MALSARLQVRQTQSLVITPQLLQAIRLLQMSGLELERFVAAEIEQNPLLEREDGERVEEGAGAAEPASGEAAESGMHSERGRIADVAYAGMITRYLVELDAGGTLQVVHQNLETSSQEALEQKGREVVVAWHPDHTVAVAAGNEREEAP